MMVAARWDTRGPVVGGLACHLVLGVLWASHLCEALPKTTTTKTTTTEASTTQDVPMTIHTTFTNVSTASKEDSNEASKEFSKKDNSLSNGSTTKHPPAPIKDNSTAQVNHYQSIFEQIQAGEMVRLKGIPPSLSPDLLKFMAEAGGGDSFLLATADFPAASTARKHGIPFDRIHGTNVVTLFQDIQSLMDIQLPMVLMGHDPIEVFKQIMRFSDQHVVSFMAELLTHNELVAAAEKVSYIIQTSDPNMHYNVIFRKEFGQGKNGFHRLQGDLLKDLKTP